jgi:hypothetical protein
MALGAPMALGARKAVFPNAKSLQPIPQDIQPNISGNVNSSVSVDPYIENEQKISEETVPEPTSTEKIPEKRGPSFSMWWFAAMIIISFGIVLWYRKMKKVEHPT